ncbi:MAG: hypothetical protein ACE5G2_07410 [Candidatus Krumholzibacteriia bacterium]
MDLSAAGAYTHHVQNMFGNRRMRKLGTILILAVALLFGAVSAEELPPIPIGSGQSATQMANGQVLHMTAAGVAVTVILDQVTAARVTGMVVRTSGGPSSGSLTITWVNQSMSTTISLGPQHPLNQMFTLEGGDGDKRTHDGLH